MAQIIELIDKDIKTVMTYMFRKLEERLDMLSRHERYKKIQIGLQKRKLECMR